MKIRILSCAIRDLVEGYRFYEKQRPGIGSYFLDALYADIDSLLVNAGIHPIYFGHYHRLLSRRFPFAIYYRIEDETVLVYAVLDCRRNPAWAKGKAADR